VNESTNLHIERKAIGTQRESNLGETIKGTTINQRGSISSNTQCARGETAMEERRLTRLRGLASLLVFHCEHDEQARESCVQNIRGKLEKALERLAAHRRMGRGTTS
jgi:hypothetical protein